MGERPCSLIWVSKHLTHHDAADRDQTLSSLILLPLGEYIYCPDGKRPPPTIPRSPGPINLHNDVSVAAAAAAVAAANEPDGRSIGKALENIRSAMPSASVLKSALSISMKARERSLQPQNSVTAQRRHVTIRSQNSIRLAEEKETALLLPTAVRMYQVSRSRDSIMMQ